MTEQCGKDSFLMLMFCVLLFFGGLIAFNLGRKLWLRFLASLGPKTPNGHQEKTLLYAIAKYDSKKVRVSFQKEMPNGEISAFSVDMEPTAAVEFAQALKTTAHSVANLELV